MRTVIIDDIGKNREMLATLLADFCPQVEIVGQAAGVTAAEQVVADTRPDLLLLDVEMPDGTGFDLLERFDEPDFEVIFVTAHDRYALRAIKFCALDYILKPVSAKELAHAVHRAGEKWRERRSRARFAQLITNIRTTDSRRHKIAIPTHEGFLFVEVDGIIRCEAEGSYTRVIRRGKPPILATRKIKGFEELLNDYGFFRVHRSHLINLSDIEKYHRGEGGYVVLSDGSSVDVSRRKKEEFLERLNSV